MESRTDSKDPRARSTTIIGDDIVWTADITNETAEVVIKKATVTNGNEDFILHLKYYDWRKIFEFFRNNDGIAATLATKFVPVTLLDANYPGTKSVRIRMSLMPQRMSDIMEPNTSSILDRIMVINKLIDKGYDVHVNFSPVIMYQQWRKDYIQLFEMLDYWVEDKYKPSVLSEVIFLTHEDGKHKHNIADGFEYEHLLWQPSIQEHKISQLSEHKENAVPAIRYRADLKVRFQQEFERLHKQIIPWNTIRYIF